MSKAVSLTNCDSTAALAVEGFSGRDNEWLLIHSDGFGWPAGRGRAWSSCVGAWLDGTLGGGAVGGLVGLSY